MAAADRLSALADDVLQRILSFAPAREAAASAALSRRWRPLWRRTGALNLDSRPYSREHCRNYDDRFDDFFSHGKAALASRLGTPLRRLTLYLVEQAYLAGDKWDYRMNEEKEPEYDPRAAGLLADPAAAALEELRIAGEYPFACMYVPPLASLPCTATTLRVLELHYCSLEPPSTEPSASLAFPHVTDLTMRDCTYLEWYLQALVDAMPALTRLALVDVTNKPLTPPPVSTEDSFMLPTSKSSHLPLRLASPTVTALVLETNRCLNELDDSRNIGIQLDMPSLRSFRYKGFPFKLSLTSPAPGLARVHLDTNRRESDIYKCEPTARVLASFCSTRSLRLHLSTIEDIVSDNCYRYRDETFTGDQKPGEEVILPTFVNLKLLEIDASFNYMDNNTALALATLLRACPAMSELRLRLNMNYDYHYDRKTEEQAGGQFAQSMERFNMLGSMCSKHRDDVELGGVSELPAAFANSRAFDCLRTSLRKVTLQFKSKEHNCFQVQLARFLVEKAMVLEEMHVEDGDQFWPDHLLVKLTRWRHEAFRRMNLPDTSGFRVHQLANPFVGAKVQY
ncbi:hypothetical protein ZWY2020_009997 [Hordeum vulgare]|nr:hypothetical protein ZWY2020_009997 [Hordeum vulgare]